MFKWYACKEKNCNEIDNSFYLVKDRNGENIIDEWVIDTQVEFEFFETNTFNQPSFYIHVLIDKNDGESEICPYSVEIEVIDSRIPDILLDFNELDCLNIISRRANIEITGKLSIKFAPRLKQIKLDVPSSNNIEFFGNDKLSTTINLIELETNDDFTNYEFKFNINILTYGKGNISTSFITQSGSILNIQNTYEFFIIPNLYQHLNNSITTTLPWSCSNVGKQTNNAPLKFESNQTITTTLDLKLFSGFLDRFIFIYSIAEVVTPNFCNTNDLDSISSYKEVVRINGNQTNGVTHTFTATLTPQQLNNLPRPFTYAVRLEVKRIDTTCSNIFNLRGYTVLNAVVACPNKIPYQTLKAEVI
jgi:hypothetical protein